VADRPGHDRRYAIDATRIRRELGWASRHTFETGIAGDAFAGISSTGRGASSAGRGATTGSGWGLDRITGTVSSRSHEEYA